MHVKEFADVAARESSVNGCPPAYPRLGDDPKAYIFVLIFMRVSKSVEKRPLALSYPSVCMSALCLSVYLPFLMEQLDCHLTDFHEI